MNILVRTVSMVHNGERHFVHRRSYEVAMIELRRDNHFFQF